MNQPDWDRKMTFRLTALGIPWEKAREVVGIIAEERQTADYDGYKRGFEDGCEATEKKWLRELTRVDE